jgi:hypothetical protein
MRNRDIQKNNTSGKKGVWFSSNSWCAQIGIGDCKVLRKAFSVSKYNDAKERAIRWRQDMEKKYEYLN